MSAPDGGNDDMTATTMGSDDMAVANTPADMANRDMSGLPDAAGTDAGSGCVGGTPDEDNDGRADSCDVCPADPDPTPVDTDGDGLPDACDPDPSVKSNANVYIELFNTASGHWSGNNPITGSYMNVDTNGIGASNASNGTDTMPLLVRVQAMILPTAEHGNNGGDTGVFVGTNPSVNQATGVYCALTWNSGSSDTLNIYQVNNGAFGVPTTASLGAQLSGTVYRLRLTQRAGTWTCEVVSSAMASPVTATTMQAVTAPLYITLQNDNMGSHFHSIVAESLAPLYSPDIQADLDAKGCTISACHGSAGDGSVMYVKANATAQADIDTNYADVKAEINFTTPDQSALLRNPLAGSGSGHAGTTPFMSTSDPTYQRWLNWINNGAPKQ